ncbi:MAG: carbohydrate kinase family protein [Oscillospiraceae bacterium]
MKKGICCAGNMIVDITYPIETWPKQNELTHITEGITRSTGGSVCNTITDLARLDPALPLVASGFAGHDAEGDFVLQEMGKYKNIDLSMVKRSGDTSFTAVMSNNQTKERTFFQYAGGSAYYGEDDIDWDKLNVDIFHIGYILLLPHLDEPDAEYGTKMARLLHRAQQAGMKTSIDVVSEAGERFKRLVTPALKYTDYCIINELETQQTTGVLLREEDGTLHVENMKAALQKLHELGVAKWAVIHCPETRLRHGRGRKLLRI